MVYRVTENPPPDPAPGIRNPRTGATHVTTFDDSDVEIIPINDVTAQQSQLVRYPFYQIVNTSPTGRRETPSAPTPVIIQPTIINSSATLSSIYDDLAGMSTITARTKVTNDGGGPDTSFDIVPVIWDTGSNVINVYAEKEIIEVQIRFTVATDTLGGAFELDLESVTGAELIHREEKSVNIQDQDFTINLKVVTKSAWMVGGICIFIKPELGMSIDLSDIEFTFIKTTQLA